MAFMNCKNLIISCFFLLSYGLQARGIDSLWVATNYTKKEVMIPMRDGVKLFTTIYAPKNESEKHPILMVRTPYSVAPYGAAFSPRIYSPHWQQYLKEGYILVLQDVRGCYMSEGQFVDVRPFIQKKKKSDIDESTDAYDTIDWLVKNVKSNNGNVGCFGISYPGFYATMTALSGHPALKAVSPQAPVTDWFTGDDFHHNGAFALMDAFHFYSGFGRPRPTPTTKGKAGFEIPSKDNYDWFLKQGAVSNFSKLLGDSIVFWKDLVAHPDMDAFWTARDARRACTGLKPAMLVVGGTFDAEDCFGAWNLYKAIESQNPGLNNKLVMGPWFHGGWSRGEGSYLGNIRFGSATSPYYQQDMEVLFFNHHLKGKGEDNLAEANIFFTGENNWTNYSSWPPNTTTMTPVYLCKGGKISFDAPTEKNSSATYRSDPAKPVPYTEDVHLNRTREYMDDDQRFASRRPDVLVYETEVLTQDLTLAGPVIADLKVKLSSTDADFVVKIIDVFPDDFVYADGYCCKGVKNEPEMGGYQMLVRGEIFRGRYRDGFDKPKAFAPGNTETVKFTLPDVAHTFLKGHKLMIQVQSSWFPIFDRNPQKFVNIYTCGDDAFVPADITIMQQADAASNIVLPVLKK